MFEVLWVLKCGPHECLRIVGMQADCFHFGIQIPKDDQTRYLHLPSAFCTSTEINISSIEMVADLAMDKKTYGRGGVRCRLSDSSTREDGVGGLHRADHMGVY